MAIVNVESGKGAPEKEISGKKAGGGLKKGEAVRLQVYGPRPALGARARASATPAVATAANNGDFWITTTVVKIMFPDVIPLDLKKVAAITLEVMFMVVWFCLMTLSFDTLLDKYLIATNATKASTPDDDNWTMPIEFDQLVDAVTPKVAMTKSAMNTFATGQLVVYFLVIILMGLLCWGIRKESVTKLLIWTSAQLFCTFLLGVSYILYAKDHEWFNFVGVFYIMLLSGRTFVTGLVVNILINVQEKADAAEAFELTAAAVRPKKWVCPECKCKGQGHEKEKRTRPEEAPARVRQPYLPGGGCM